MKYDIRSLKMAKDGDELHIKAGSTIISTFEPYSGQFSNIDNDAAKIIEALLKAQSIPYKRQPTHGAGDNVIISTTGTKKFLKNILNFQRSRKQEDLIPGGKGDDKPTSMFDTRELSIGIEIEKEHVGQDIKRATEVAKDHLTEDPKYYSKLIKSGLVDEPKALLLYKKYFK